MNDYQFPKVHISAEDRKRYASYTYESIFALKLIQVLPTKFLAQCLDDTNEEHHALCRHIGLITNLCWLTAAVAEELYLTRHVISEATFNDVTLNLTFPNARILSQ